TLIDLYGKLGEWATPVLEETFKQLATEKNMKPGELLLPFRIMLVGGKFGPAVFDIASLIGKDQTLARMEKALQAFNS
ncbi:MAG: glutamate--tRNA ligase, partial [Ferruginibacter sp.]